MGIFCFRAHICSLAGGYLAGGTRYLVRRAGLVGGNQGPELCRFCIRVSSLVTIESRRDLFPPGVSTAGGGDCVWCTLQHMVLVHEAEVQAEEAMPEH